MWPLLFGLVNGVAFFAWLVLVFAPRRPLPLAAVLYLGVGLLCLAYITLLGLLVSGVLDAHPVASAGKAGFTTIGGVRAIFLSDGGVVVGWTHYLAFDLFVGLWIAKDADAKGFGRLVQLPLLLATFMAGPLGLLLYLALREPRARSGTRR